MFGKVIKVVKQAKAKSISRDCNVRRDMAHTIYRETTYPRFYLQTDLHKGVAVILLTHTKYLCENWPAQL